jgi:hypothetical protein
MAAAKDLEDADVVVEDNGLLDADSAHYRSQYRLLTERIERKERQLQREQANLKALLHDPAAQPPPGVVRSHCSFPVSCTPSC